MPKHTSIKSYDANPDAITPVEYGGLQHAFDHLNAVLFQSALLDCLLTLQRRANSGGHFAPDRFSERGGTERRPEVNLNPNGFVGRTDAFIVSILLHELVHFWQEMVLLVPVNGAVLHWLATHAHWITQQDADSGDRVRLGQLVGEGLKLSAAKAVKETP